MSVEPECIPCNLYVTHLGTPPGRWLTLPPIAFPTTARVFAPPRLTLSPRRRDSNASMGFISALISRKACIVSPYSRGSIGVRNGTSKVSLRVCESGRLARVSTPSRVTFVTNFKVYNGRLNLCRNFSISFLFFYFSYTRWVIFLLNFRNVVIFLLKWIYIRCGWYYKYFHLTWWNSTC